MKLPIHSLRWRIQAWHGLLLFLVLAGFGAMAFQLENTSESRHVDAELQLRASALLGNIARQPHPAPPDGEDEPSPFFPGDEPGHAPRPGSFRLRPELAPLFTPARDGTAFYYRVWTRDGAMFGSSPNAPPGLQMPTRSPNRGMVFRHRDGMREATDFTPPGECLLVGISKAAQQRQMTWFVSWLVGTGVLVLACGLTVGGRIAAQAIAPIGAISDAANRVASGRLDERIPATGTGSELDQLTGVLNHAFAQVEAAFAEQARFTSDAAHELRTPISVMLAQTQLALARPRSADEYRASIEITRRAALRMQSLIESLLTLARVEARSEPSHCQPCDLSQIAREQLDLIRPLADERGIVLHQDLAPAVCTADPDRLAQVCVNLLSNAVKYNRVGGTVSLASTRVNSHAVLSVSDTGDGIAAEHLPHLFERFYRADASRNRATGGAGLGLAICKTLVEAQGGTIEVFSVETQGSTFTLRLPAQSHDTQET